MDVALFVAVLGAGYRASKMRGPKLVWGLLNLYPTSKGGGYKYLCTRSASVFSLLGRNSDALLSAESALPVFPP